MLPPVWLTTVASYTALISRSARRPTMWVMVGSRSQSPLLKRMDALPVRTSLTTGVLAPSEPDSVR